STARIDAMLAGALDAEHGVTALVRGQPREILERRSAAVIERRFVLPHIAHAPLEPVNATASYKHGSVEVWGSIQSVIACQEAVAQAVGCAPDDVKVNVTFLGGSFGRKIVPDYVLQAVQASKAVGRPVKLIRSLGSTAAVFFWESFITELAQRGHIDQYAYRRNLLLEDPLAMRVLDAVARASGWGTTPNVFRGIAYNCYIGRGGRFKTYVAEVVELARIADGLAVTRVFCAVDPGLAVNPNTLRAQIEGGIGFALTTALKSRITFANGGAEQSNFFDYPLLGIDEMPEIVPIVLPSDRPPQGFGEVVLAPVAPALAQA